MVITPNPFNLEGNELKTAVQKQARSVQLFHKRVVHKCYVGFGKTNIGKGALIDFISSSTFLDHIVILCPSDLKPMWQSILSSLSPISSNTAGWDVMTIQEYVLKDKEKVWHIDFLLVDECHRILNKNSEYFSGVLRRTETKNVCLLSGTLSKEHIEFLKLHNVDTMFEATKLWGYKNGLIPRYTIVNIPIKLTLNEKSQYSKIQTEIEGIERSMNIGGIYDMWIPTSVKKLNDYEEEVEIMNPHILNAAKELGWEPGAVINKLNGWKVLINKRKTILYNAENKIPVIAAILAEIPEQVFVYTKSIAFADRIAKMVPTSTVIHSKLRIGEVRKAIGQFALGLLPHVISVDKLKEGVNYPEVRFALRAAYTGSPKDTEQIGGRVIRLDDDNPDKEAYVIHTYVQSFEAGGRLLKSQEEVWLTNNLADELNPVYLNSAEEGIAFVKQLINGDVEV